MSRKIIQSLRAELSKDADSKKALQMQVYMKSAMPFHGVPAPLLKKICRKFFAEIELSNRLAWQKLVIGLWQNAKYREERYAAIYLVGISGARSFQTMASMKMYEERKTTALSCIHTS